MTYNPDTSLKYPFLKPVTTPVEGIPPAVRSITAIADAEVLTITRAGQKHEVDNGIAAPG